MEFKDALENDLTNVFFKEFAEKVCINGQMMEIVPDNYAVNKSNPDKKLSLCDVVFHVNSSNFEHLPKPELYMEFEGEEYKIKSVIESIGMLTIGLSRNES